jgi:hypothetical protein
MLNHQGHKGHQGKASQVFTFVSFVSLVVNMTAQGGSPTLRTIDRGDRSQIMSARQVVARTQAEWDALWRAHLPERPPAAIDLSKEMVVGVFLGSKPTAGYSVSIVSVAEEGGALRVRYRETLPPADAITAQVITYPYQIVAIPKSAATDVKFERVP